ncbi:MAG TPA: TlpA disulfide reductase family protein [Pirellulaceae bacterium]|nr:TlpA disulfide reductase family protein [Pirellulaceae bacterium]
MNQPAFSDDKPNDQAAKYRDSSYSFTRIIVIMIGGLFAILLVRALQPEKHFGAGEIHPGVGRAMESLDLAPLIGETAPITLESLRGEVVLINFWGTWCGYCLMEFPHLVELNDRLKGDTRFRFVPVSCGPGGADVDSDQLRAETEAYLAKLETDLDVYSDPGAGARLSLVKSARLSGFGYPTTVLIDRDGTIRGLWEGYGPGVEAEMEQVIRALLKS